MTKPKLDDLIPQVAAIRNQLDVAVWSYLSQGRHDVDKEPHIKELAAKYHELTGEHYVYQDTRGRFGD